MIKRIYRYIKVLGVPRLLMYFFHEVKMLGLGIFYKSFSQSKDDLLLDILLDHKQKGVYVDVGAYDPTRFSNTKRFYLRGWSGINIEPNPDKIGKFYKERPSDVNLNIGIANKFGVLNFYRFEPNTLSTFSKKTAFLYKKQGFNLESITKVRVKKLKNILSKYLKNNLDFLNIDTEGMDLEVLKSNDWLNFKPTVVCVETSLSADNFLRRLNYKKIYQTPTNSLFLLKNDL